MSGRSQGRARRSKSVRHLTSEDYTAGQAGSMIVARYPPHGGPEPVLWQVDRTRCPHLEPLLGGGSFCLVSGAGHLTIQKGEHIEELQLNADQHEVHVLQSGAFYEVVPAPEMEVLSLSASPSIQHNMRIFSLFKEEMVVVGEAESLLVLYGVLGTSTAYFPRLLKLGQQMCLCPDCRADGGGDGFKLREGETLMMHPGDSIGVVAVDGPAKLVAISIWTRQKPNPRL
ncbi:unnamed protein product [Durusdinium trenchii]|uniref:Altered inheritance of mitochondria protein 24, mitochondrial n=1 Tax=Durusdinium trenchii TaxID=1381693 RepID=A0ABP0S957_9DINO